MKIVPKENAQKKIYIYIGSASLDIPVLRTFCPDKNSSPVVVVVAPLYSLPRVNDKPVPVQGLGLGVRVRVRG